MSILASIMYYTNKKYITQDHTELELYYWDCEAPKGIVHIVHGMSEHAARYDEFAAYLNQHGYIVRASDLRGHGKTADGISKVGNFAMENGWQKVVNDIIVLSQFFKTETPDLPLILAGHSMGSFIAREVISKSPTTAELCILSATGAHPGLKGSAGVGLAKLNASLMGKKNRSSFLQSLTFAGFNNKFKDGNTGKEWLSRDPHIVQDYINDDYCMQTFSSQFFVDLASGVLHVNSGQVFNNTPKDLPILLFAGDMDPVGNYGKGPQRVAKDYIDAGVKDVTLKIYEGGRHEMLNEINRDEVYLDVLNWIDTKLS